MRVCVVGAGYVGLTTAACLADRGHEVACVDVDPARVALVQEGRVPFHEPGLAELLQAGLASGRLRVTGDLAGAVRDAELTVLAVGTPERDGAIHLSYVERAAGEIGQALRDAGGYRVVVVKSTVPPGTTDTLVREAVEQGSGLAAGEFGLCANPEFLREGSAVADFLEPDRIVIGRLDERSGAVLARAYESFDCPVVLTTLRNAELAKYAANALLATLISFSNELAAVCEATPGTDVREVLRAVHLDRRLTPVVDGTRVEPGILSFLWAGCGFGGSCLPKDVNALRAYARAAGADPALLDAVAGINGARPPVLSRFAEAELGSLDGAEVTVLGLAFKPGTDDLRASPALAVVDDLLARGARVRAYDPLVASVDGLEGRVRLCATPEEALADADAALLVTAPPGVARWDWAALCSSMRRPVVVDGRGALADVAWPAAARYLAVGRVNA
jgi:UDPglucose 6-dehydrogenase